MKIPWKIVDLVRIHSVQIKGPSRSGSCEKKKRYESIDIAAGNASAQNRQNGNNALSAYKCLFCKGYHIGHKYYEKRSSLRTN